MSKNNKMANKLAKARAMKMTKGPASTAKKNTKVRTWYHETSPTFWRKPKEDKKKDFKEGAQAGLEFFRALQAERDKADRLKKMRIDG